jgi:pyruvate dehydrogenase E2 component (dihydrolipoamide acetyltransferase)
LSDVEHWLAASEKQATGAKKASRKPAATPATTTATAEQPADSRQRQSVKPGLDMAMMRKAIAAAMSRSKREIPHYYLSHRIDLQTATEWLAARNADCDPEQRVLMGALFVKALALALIKVPELNGTYENDVFTPAKVVNCGLAISMRGGGLIAPALMDVGAQSLDELMQAMRDVVARTRTGRLRNSEITQGTITVSSMGENGADSLLGVIYPPQVALVGFGTPVRRPWVVDDEVQVRNIVDVTLAADHRASDGRRGARLLTEIERLLGEPDQL